MWLNKELYWFKKQRGDQRKIRKQLFDLKVSKLLCGILDDPELKIFLSQNICFNRDIDIILHRYGELTRCKKVDLTVSDIDGVLVAPLYRPDWSNRNYRELTHAIAQNSIEVILFSNAVQIPLGTYQMLQICGASRLFPNWLPGHLPLVIPDSLVRSNQGYRKLPPLGPSGILLDLLDPYLVSKVETTQFSINNNEGKFYPKYQYLDKKHRSSRLACMSNIYQQLKTGNRVVFLGSSVFDRSFYHHLLLHLKSQGEIDNLDFPSYILNLYYLDSDLTFI